MRVKIELRVDPQRRRGVALDLGEREAAAASGRVVPDGLSGQRDELALGERLGLDLDRDFPAVCAAVLVVDLLEVHLARLRAPGAEPDRH